MVVSIHQPQYLPWLPYFDKIRQADTFVYLDDVQYQQNGLQNRNQIKTANGAQWLTVPVHTHSDTPINQVTLNTKLNWRAKHIRSLQQNYAKAAHRQLVDEAFAPLLEREWANLAELSIAVTEWMCEVLGIQTKRVRASELGAGGVREERVLNICRELGAETYLSGRGAEAYQEPAHFEAAGIELRYHAYAPPEYEQCFPKAGFVPQLSAIDLILNHGETCRGWW